MSREEALRLQAFLEVTRGDGMEYRLRKIFRWYSEHFHTALHVVEDLPLDDVLRHYYEVHYEEMAKGAPDDFDAERKYLIQTPREREEEERRAASVTAETDDYAAEVAAEEAAKEIAEVAAQARALATTIQALPEKVSLRFDADLDDDPLFGPNLSSDGGPVAKP